MKRKLNKIAGLKNRRLEARWCTGSRIIAQSIHLHQGNFKNIPICSYYQTWSNLDKRYSLGKALMIALPGQAE
jgi:hypothetical protein